MIIGTTGIVRNYITNMWNMNAGHTNRVVLYSNAYDFCWYIWSLNVCNSYIINLASLCKIVSISRIMQIVCGYIWSTCANIMGSCQDKKDIQWIEQIYTFLNAEKKCLSKHHVQTV